MTVLIDITVLFTLALGLAFLVERFLEVLVALFHMFDSRLDLHRFWTARAYRLRDRLESKLRVYEYVSPENAAALLNNFHDVLLNRRGHYQGKVPVISGDLIRVVWLKVCTKIIGVILGITLAVYLQIDLVSVWRAVAGDSVSWLPHISERLSTLFTGILLGFGAEPVHKVITYIEKKRKQRGSIK